MKWMKKTDFLKHDGSYCNTGMFFGLKISQATFPTAMERILETAIWRYTFASVRNVAVFTPILKTHIEWVGKVRMVLQELRMTLILNNYPFFRTHGPLGERDHSREVVSKSEYDENLPEIEKPSNHE